jgi:cobalamin 5'-phosphate synthase/cobalamin synthase
MTRVAREVAAAASFLTRLPVPGDDPAGGIAIGRSAAWFPLIGLLIGTAHVATATAFGRVLPPSVTAVIVLIVDALLTSGLHMDGLADTADGLGGGWNRRGALKIMRDPAIGAYGAIALILMLALRWAVSTELIGAAGSLLPMLAAPVAGRWAGVTLGLMLPYARDPDDGCGPIVSGIGVREWILASLVAFPLVTAAFGGAWLLAIGGAGLSTAWWVRTCRRRIGGVTGDTLGAAIAVTESVVLTIGLLR